MSSPVARLKIALVGLTYPFRGGIAHYTTLLYHALAARHEVAFFALSRQYPRLLFPGRSQRDESTRSLAAPATACLDSMNPWTWLSTARRIRAFAPDLVLVSWWHPFFAPCFGTVTHLLRLVAGVPSCYLCHNVMPHERSLVDRVLRWYAFSSARSFITHSRQDRDTMARLRPRAEVRDSPHPSYAVFGGEGAPTRAAAREALGLVGRRVLLFFGFVRDYKGLDVLLAATARLAPEDGYHLLVVGEFYDDPGRYRAALDQLAARGQLTLVDRYVANEEVPLYFAAADLVMVPYRSATQSGVVQVAYGFGRAVVATTVGGLPEVVSDGRTGFLVPPDDPAAMAAAVARYFALPGDEPLRPAIEREQARFSWERMVETVEATAAGRHGS